MNKTIALLLIAASTMAMAKTNYNYTLEKQVNIHRKYHPFFVTNDVAKIERLNIDISIDGGSNWTHHLYKGYPVGYGDNLVNISLPVTEDMWSENCLIFARTLWTSTTNGADHGESFSKYTHEGDTAAPFKICGMHLISPSAESTIYSPSYMPITWHEAGPDYVKIGLSLDGSNFVEQAVVESTAATNTYILPITDIPTGPVWLIVAAVGFDDLYDIKKLNCINIQ